MVNVSQRDVEVMELAEPWMLQGAREGTLQDLDEETRGQVLESMRLLPPIGAEGKTSCDTAPSLIKETIWI